MEALDAQKTETDENSSGALGAGEHGGGSHQLQSPGSARAPTSKSECTKICNRSKCGFLFDDRLNYADADMVCVSVHDEMEGEPADGEEESGFDAGSALDQLLWRQKAVSGMETRRPGESVQQFFQRRTAGMRMLKAEAGGAEAKALENEVDAALQASSTQWHWGQGDHDADLSDDEREIVKQLDAPKKTVATSRRREKGTLAG